jgi:hypothetical protein
MDFPPLPMTTGTSSTAVGMMAGAFSVQTTFWVTLCLFGFAYWFLLKKEKWTSPFFSIFHETE